MAVYANTKFLSLPQQVNQNKKDIEALEQNQADISNLIPKTEKGAPLGVATLGADGKVPSAQLPANPGNFLPLAGGIMQGSVDMDGYNISTAGSVDTGSVFTNQINSLSPDIKVAKALDMENNKIVDVAKGTSTKDVATIDNINDHDTSPFAHADIRNLIAAIQGTYVYVGKINLATASVTDTALNNTVFAILARTPLNGDVLVDNENGEWRFDGTNWVNLGHFDIALASALNDGLMTKEQYTKLFDLYTKAQLDDTFEVLTNKATDFTVVNDTKYPTTKAISERLLNLPIAELNNHTLREVFEGGNLITNGNFDTNITGWLGQSGSNAWLTGGFLQSTGSGLNASVLVYRDNGSVPSSTDNIYQIQKLRVTNNLTTQIRVTYDGSTGGSDKIVITLNNPIQNQWYNLSVKNTFPADASGLNRTKIEHGYLNSTNANGSVMEIDYVYSVNMTTLGISSLTVVQMDYWFNVYQALLVSDTNAIFSLIAQNKTAIDTKANIAQEAWITPTLLNGWTNFSTIYNNAGYYKDSMGIVRLRGLIKGGGIEQNIFTLPPGYRPGKISLFSTVSNSAFASFYIDSNGQILCFAGSNASFSLENISFRAEA